MWFALTLVEDPDFARRGRFRYTVSVVVKHSALIPRALSQRQALLLCLFDRGVQNRLVLDFRVERFELIMQV
jgi:hypothetical protein